MALYVPKVIGHRGAKAYAPENTLSSIHAAADMGIEWVEIDVKLTADGEAIIFHDEELDRTTNGSGLVRNTKLQDIRELDAGSWFSESYIGEKIPTLDEALEVILNRGLGLNLEIKPCEGREVETAEVALDILTRVWPDDVAPPLLSSFQAVSLETAMHMIESYPRGMLFEEHQENWQDIMEYLAASTLNIDGRKVTQDQIEEYLEYRKPILCYTINDPILAKRLINWGVDSLFSDNPDVIRDVVEPRH
jgi:glycerophosphoryl diester phosphodiesterase